MGRTGQCRPASPAMNKPAKNKPEKKSRRVSSPRTGARATTTSSRNGSRPDWCCEGWEVKSMRAGKAQVAEAYVYLKEGEAFLFGATSPRSKPPRRTSFEPTRTRKLLLNKSELSRLVGSVERKGYTLVPLDLHWKDGRAKLEIGLAKGKKQHDKRATEKDRDWQRGQGASDEKRLRFRSGRQNETNGARSGLWALLCGVHGRRRSCSGPRRSLRQHRSRQAGAHQPVRPDAGVGSQ